MDWGPGETSRPLPEWTEMSANGFPTSHSSVHPQGRTEGSVRRLGGVGRVGGVTETGLELMAGARLKPSVAVVCQSLAKVC